MKLKVYKLYCIAFVVLFYFNINIFGQERMNTSLGFGFFELANMGFRYQIAQTELGINIGTIPLSEDTHFSIIGNLYVHMGDTSEISNRKPWYFRFGVNYYYIKNISENSYKIENVTYFIWRIGKEFNLSTKVGIYFDLGINVQIEYHEDNFPKPTEPVCCQGMGDLFEEFPILPSIGIGVFYNF